MQELRKILRALAITIFAALSFRLVIDAVQNGPCEYQLAITAVLMLGVVGLTATWFWSPFQF
jgi:hypothetical protein